MFAGRARLPGRAGLRRPGRIACARREAPLGTRHDAAYQHISRYDAETRAMKHRVASETVRYQWGDKRSKMLVLPELTRAKPEADGPSVTDVAPVLAVAWFPDDPR